MLYPGLLPLMSGSTRVAPRYLATTTASAICVRSDPKKWSNQKNQTEWTEKKRRLGTNFQWKFCKIDQKKMKVV